MLRKRLLFGLTVSAALCSAPRSRAEPYPRALLDAIAAVVDGDPILLSDLRPFLSALPTQPVFRLGNEQRYQKMLRAALERRIEALLVSHHAARHSIAVNDADVDRTLDSIATSQGTTRAELMSRVRLSGMSAARYRDEVRQQLLEFHVLNDYLSRRNLSHARGADDDTKRKELENWRRQFVRELRRTACIERYY